MTTNMPGFCAAPWVEGVLYQDGLLRTCCRNTTTFANWQTDGLSQGWHSDIYQTFRARIHAGEFPDSSCRRCHQNGTARSLASELNAPFGTYRQKLAQQLDEAALVPIDALQQLFVLNIATDDTGTILSACDQALHIALSHVDTDGEQAVNKLQYISQVTRAFLYGDITPPIVAPFRQVQLVAKCNARCIHCPGLFSEEIIRGPALDEHYIDAAFAHPEHIFDFFMNGSEFLVFKGWQTVAQRLARNGVQLTISTNGIRLNREAIRFLIDNRIVRTLNISLDGAQPETIETIRVNVNYDELVDNLHYLLAYANEQQYNFDLAFSFVLMRRNYREFPQLVEWAHKLKGNYPLPHIHVYCQALETFLYLDGYIDFIRQEHHTLIDHDELAAVFKETQRISAQTDIPVECFYSQSLPDFIAQGYPFPPAPFNLQVLEPEQRTETTLHFKLAPKLHVHSALSPGANSFRLSANNGQVVTLNLQGQLQVETQDVATKQYLFAVIVQGNKLWVARETGWQMYQAELAQVLAQGIVTTYGSAKLDTVQDFTFGEHTLQADTLDVYFGYALMTQLAPDNLNRYFGASYRIIKAA